MHNKKVIIIGASAGCLDALSKILPSLPSDYPYPILIVVHLPRDKESLLASLLNQKCALDVSEADDKEPILPGHIYVAPPDYHMLIEEDETISLSVDGEVMFSRPSIDVSFQSAADTFGPRLLGIILTGGNNDGASGLAKIAAEGGETIVQDPLEAYAPAMPEYAIIACPQTKIMNLYNITEYLKTQGNHV